jgi:hypothetical protein
MVTRSTVGALALGAVLLIALPRHGSLGADFVNTFSVAFCFTFFGSYIDALLLALPDVRIGVGRLVRLAGWFAGGLWCYVAARWLWLKFGRDLGELPGLVWGGVLLVVLQPLMNRAAGRSDTAL